MPRDLSEKQISLRSPDQVMRLERLGAAHQSRLSFLRQLLRRAATEQWQFSRPKFDLDAQGVGLALYEVDTGSHIYTLVAFAHDLPDDQRSDRVIAQAWDATFTLFDGRPSADDLERLSQNVPYQEAGRISERELTLARANRSGRVWGHVVTALAAGAQPDPELLDQVGYLMRTTAVYGSGKFGAADFETYASRPDLGGPFQAEMLTVWLIRSFVRDLVNHHARVEGGQSAASLSPEIASRLGIGNATGLGMAPFLVAHPRLIHAWINARETAIARVRAVEAATEEEVAQFQQCLTRFITHLETWQSRDETEAAHMHRCAADLKDAQARDDLLSAPYPWEALLSWSEQTLSVYGQEALCALILEPYPTLVDPLCAQMGADEASPVRLDSTQTVGEMLAFIDTHCAWALAPDIAQNADKIWYASIDKKEPRLGSSALPGLSEYERPLNIAQQISTVHQWLQALPKGSRLSAVLHDTPIHRDTLTRIQSLAQNPYAEIRDNLVADGMRPIDLLRAKLAFFGARRFDPQSDLWLRITLFQGAPYPEGLTAETAENWVYT